MEMKVREKELRMAIIDYDNVIHTIVTEIHRISQVLYVQGLEYPLLYAVQLPGVRMLPVGHYMQDLDYYDTRKRIVLEGDSGSKVKDLCDKLLQYDKALTRNLSDCTLYLQNLKRIYEECYRLRLCYLIIDTSGYLLKKYQKANCPRDKRSLKLKEEISLLYFSSLEREDLKALSTGSGKAKIYGKVIVKGNLMFEL